MRRGWNIEHCEVVGGQRIGPAIRVNSFIAFILASRLAPSVRAVEAHCSVHRNDAEDAPSFQKENSRRLWAVSRKMSDMAWKVVGVATPRRFQSAFSGCELSGASPSVGCNSIMPIRHHVVRSGTISGAATLRRHFLGACLTPVSVIRFSIDPIR